MRLDGTDDYIDLGSPADLNLVGQMTFFVMPWRLAPPVP